ncbi:hypothetical protein [Sphingomonas sp. Leaf339]|uniref:hypothetical protein n=1 Tax=Sphingomonas sp. Leaf339 TaxID=1736343 RepID=UPI0012E347C1|nr:hypothetical protein [Sphingomonas sp. Leaf339]
MNSAALHRSNEPAGSAVIADIEYLCRYIARPATASVRCFILHVRTALSGDHDLDPIDKNGSQFISSVKRNELLKCYTNLAIVVAAHQSNQSHHAFKRTLFVIPRAAKVNLKSRIIFLLQRFMITTVSK